MTKITRAWNHAWFPLAVLAVIMGICEGMAQGTAFTYQGHLDNVGVPANGTYDFQFGLYLYSTGQSQVGSTVQTNGVLVTNGDFTAIVDFGQGVYNGSNYWMQAGVRTNNSTNFTTLAPRQPVTAVPYAVMAASANGLTGGLPSAALSGTYTNTVSLNNPANGFTGSFGGDGRNLANLDASNLTTGTVSNSVLGINIFNVKKYGAVGNGSADDSMAISNAVRAWMNSGTGGTLYFPAGQYNDTNTYTFKGTVNWIKNLGEGNFNLFYNYDVVGDGIGSSVWAAKITNSIFITDDSGVNFRNISLLNPTNSGTNTAYFAGGAFASQHWQNTQLYGWTVGADFQGIAAGVLDRCVAINCFIGYRLPGYCDAWQGNLQLWHCSCGLEVGGTAKSFAGNYSANGSSFYLSGSSDGYLAVIGNCASFAITGSDTEAETNAVFAIGHPPALSQYDGAYPDTAVGNILIQDVHAQSGATVLCQLFARPAAIIETACTITGTNIASTSPSFDGTPVLFNGSQDWGKFAYSTGALLNDNADLTVRVNWSDASFVGTNKVAGTDSSGNTTAQTFSGPLPPPMPDTNVAQFAAAVTSLGGSLSYIEYSALNWLAAEAKFDGSWTNLDALYPMVGGTANSMAWNLIDIHKYRGTWIRPDLGTFNANGWTSDGSSNFMDTGFNPSTASSPRYQGGSCSLFIYNGTPSETASLSTFMGADSSNPTNMAALAVNNTYGNGLQLSGLNAADFNAIAGYITNWQGVIGARRTGTAEYDWAGGQPGSATLSVTNTPNADFFLGCLNDSGAHVRPIAANFRAVAIGGGMSAQQFNTFSNDLVQFELLLNRK